MPLHDAEGRVFAVLGGVLRPQTDTLLTDSTRPSSLSEDPIETIITDASGRIVSHLDPAWLQHDVGEDPRLAEAAARWRSQGAPMESLAWTWRTGDQFVAMAAVPEANWMVFRTASATCCSAARPRAGASHLARRQRGRGRRAADPAGDDLDAAAMRKLERRALRLLDEDLPVDQGWPLAGGEIGRLRPCSSRCWASVPPCSAATRPCWPACAR